MLTAVLGIDIGTTLEEDAHVGRQAVLGRKVQGRTQAILGPAVDVKHAEIDDAPKAARPIRRGRHMQKIHVVPSGHDRLCGVCASLEQQIKTSEMALFGRDKNGRPRLRRGKRVVRKYTSTEELHAPVVSTDAP